MKLEIDEAWAAAVAKVCGGRIKAKKGDMEEEDMEEEGVKEEGVKEEDTEKIASAPTLGTRTPGED